ncbi:MAG: hypothetical protein IKW49_01630 [Opitutales bacterium]|nr:hypothetical protein [Opitutales bacterium]
MSISNRHPHADLIKAWAEGAIIQSRCEFGGWVDEVNSNPTWDPSVEYRIKPEANEPWKPKLGDEYWFLGIDFAPENAIWRDDYFDKRCFKHGNIFPTKEEVEAAIPRVETALKGTTDVSANVGTNVGSPELDGKPLSDGMSREEADSAIRSAIGLNALVDRNTSLERENGSLKEELKTLQIRCDNLHKAKEKLIANQAVIDGTTLTDGEIALIKATRSSRICRFYEDFVIVEKHDNGVATHRSSLAFFTQYPCDDAKIKAAIQQIIKEQEAR